MPPVIQPSMAGGELAPALYARVDMARYQTSLKLCRNFISQIYGGVKNRAGTRMVAETKYPSRMVRMVPFVFNQDQAYVLELGHYYLRAFTDGAALLGVTTQTNNGTMSIVQTSSGHYTITASLDTFVAGDVGKKFEVAYTGFYDQFTIAGVTSSKIITCTGTRDFTGVTLEASPYWRFAADTAVYLFETITPWSETDLPDLVYTQSADVLTVVHPSYPPQDIRRLSNGTFNVRPTEFVNGPFQPVNTDKPITVTISGTTGTVTINASAPIFKESQIGQLFYVEPLSYGQPWGPGKTVTAGNIRMSDGKYYSALGSGTTGTVAPTHSDDKASDGLIDWLYLHSGFGIAKIKTVGTLINGFSYSCTATAQGTLPEGLNIGTASPATSTATSYVVSPADASRVRVTASVAHGLTTGDSVTYAAIP